MIFQLTFTSSNLISALQQYGFVDLVIPFVLIFAVMFAILTKVKLFGIDEKETKKYNTIIAISIALLIVIPHVMSPSPNDAVNVINKFLPEFVFITLALLILLMLVGLVGGATEPTQGKPLGVVVGIAIVVAIIYLALVILNAASPTSGLPAFLSDPNFQALVIVILVLGLVIWYIGHEETDTSWRDWLNDFLGHPK